jgi:hypothetical protein
MQIGEARAFTARGDAKQTIVDSTAYDLASSGAKNAADDAEDARECAADGVADAG